MSGPALVTARGFSFYFACVETKGRYDGRAMKTFTTKDFAKWGKEGGKKSKRTLTSEQARAMAAARKAKKEAKKDAL